ncbi:MAG: hypothetical protein AAB212_08225 [Bacteroidota bacterium]
MRKLQLILSFCGFFVLSSVSAQQSSLKERNPSIAQLNPVQKGKKVTREQLFAELKKGMKDWGKEGEKRIWIVAL